jgi:hypothetical protein
MIEIGQIWEWLTYYPDERPFQTFQPGDKILIKESPFHSHERYILVADVDGDQHVIYVSDLLDGARHIG